MEEEFQEAEILWPAAGSSDDRDKVVVGGGGEVSSSVSPTMPCSVRPKAGAAPRTAATTTPVEISRRKRRCRPWPAASEEYDATTFDQETGADTDGAKGATTSDDDDGLVIVPPHVVVARRRLVVVGGGRTAAYSMCDGKGRTLKGRDLRDVRNLVLRMTGFIEE